MALILANELFRSGFSVYVFVLNALRHCELSPLRIGARKHGLESVDGWVRRKPGDELYRLYVEITPSNWRKKLIRVVRDAMCLSRESNVANVICG